jgi:hypothetical protein
MIEGGSTPLHRACGLICPEAEFLASGFLIDNAAATVGCLIRPVVYTGRGHKLRFYALPLNGHIQRLKGRM